MSVNIFSFDKPFFNLSPLGTWLVATAGSITVVTTAVITYAFWEGPVLITSFTASMAVNLLVTGLIVFKILKVFLQVKSTTTSVERTLGSTGGNKLRHIIFVIIESGMALFSIQLVRVVFSFLQTDWAISAYDLVIGINEMFYVIIRSVHFFIFSFAD
jgi:hypothetical protein